MIAWVVKFPYGIIQSIGNENNGLVIITSIHVTWRIQNKFKIIPVEIFYVLMIQVIWIIQIYEFIIKAFNVDN